MFVDGYLALCSAVGAGAATEITAPGYARQPISFSTPRNGISVNAEPWSFGYSLPGPYAGRALYDAPTGGNLLLVLPFAEPRPQPQGGPCDAGDVGSIRVSFAALAGFQNGAAFKGTVAAGALAGTCWDDADVIGPVVQGGGYAVQQRTSPLSAGVALTINRGILEAS